MVYQIPLNQKCYALVQDWDCRNLRTKDNLLQLGLGKMLASKDTYFIQDHICFNALKCWVDICKVLESLMELQWNIAYGIYEVILLMVSRLDALIQRDKNLLATVIVDIMLILMMVRSRLDTSSSSVKFQLLGVHIRKRRLHYHCVRQNSWLVPKKQDKQFGFKTCSVKSHD